MNLAYFIAKRMGVKSHNDEPTIMMRVATLAVAVGVTVMIIAIAVIGGFKTQISSRLAAVSGHIVVTDVVGVNPSARKSILRGEEVEELILKHSGTGAELTPYITQTAIAKGGSIMEGVVVKGVESTAKAVGFEGMLLDGYLPNFTEPKSRREVLISSELAKDMDIDSGARLDIIFSRNEGEAYPLTFKVAGIFSAGIGESEKGLVIANIETLRRVNGWDEEEISGYDVYVDNIDKAKVYAEEINHALLYSSSQERTIALSLQEIYPAIFDWMATHDINGMVVGVIMLIVAIFNLSTALLILVLERTRMVGILKSLGMRNSTLREIFLYRAAEILVRGVVWGNIVGVGLCCIQKYWGILKLETSGYILSTVPIELGVGWIVLLNVGFIGVVLLVMTLPVRMVASVSPDEIVKYR